MVKDTNKSCGAIGTAHLTASRTTALIAARAMVSISARTSARVPTCCRLFAAVVASTDYLFDFIAALDVIIAGAIADKTLASTASYYTILARFER